MTPSGTRVPRIAVVGTGWWSANHHVPSLAQYDGAELVALCDPRRERAVQLAAQHGVATVVLCGVLVRMLEALVLLVGGLLAMAAVAVEHRWTAGREAAR